MYNKIFKSYQISVGVPIQIKSPVNYNNVKKANNLKFDVLPNIDDIKEEEAYEKIIHRAKEEAEAIIKEAEREAVKLIEVAQIEGDKLKSPLKMRQGQRVLKKVMKRLKGSMKV